MARPTFTNLFNQPIPTGPTWIYHGRVAPNVDQFGGRQPYRFSSGETAHLDLIKESHLWCVEEFGDPDHQGRWSGTMFRWFRDEHDALHFRMRWC